MLRPHVVLDLLANFTAYATDKKKRRIKIIARYQQYEGANKIVERVVAGHPKKGLIWHFQGSGKSLLMLFAARKLRLHPALKNPTVMIVVDRIDLDTQISSTFYAADTPNLVKADSRAELQRLLAQDVRKIIITTIFKFGEADGVLNDRSNIIAMVDEAHRTQEGDLGRKMREALPNAFLFGLTGTPINRADRNTFYAFGAEEDEARLHEPLRLRGVDPRRRHDAAALRAAAARAAHRQGGDRRGVQGAHRRPQRPRPGPARQDRRQDGGAGQGAGADPDDLRRHRRALPGEGRAERLRRPGRHLRPRELRALQEGARRAPAAGDVRHRDDGQQRRGPSTRRTAATGTPRRSCSTASATRPTR